MSRVIDADTVKQDIYKYIKEDGRLINPYRMLDYIDSVETSKKAIPTEWIEERLKKALSFTHSKAEGKIVYDGCVITMVSASFTAQVLSNLLEDWEEENDSK